MLPTLTLSYIFANGADDFSVTYPGGTFVAIPEKGDHVKGIKVTARAWNYDSVNSVTVDITCG
jgi:hypothetical protein